MAPGNLRTPILSSPIWLRLYGSFLLQEGAMIILSLPNLLCRPGKGVFLAHYPSSVLGFVIVFHRHRHRHHAHTASNPLASRPFFVPSPLLGIAPESDSDGLISFQLRVRDRSRRRRATEGSSRRPCLYRARKAGADPRGQGIDGDLEAIVQGRGT